MPDLLTEIIYEEFERSPAETLDLEGFTATRVLIVPWNDRFQLRADLLRTTFPGAPDNIICTSIVTEPFQAANLGVEHVSAFEFARMTLQYETIILETTESIEPTAEFLTTGVNNLRWESPTGDQVTPEESPGQLFVGFDFVFQRESLKEFPINILDLIGKVNEGAVRPTAEGLKKLIFEKETLLYNHPTITSKFDFNGDRIWTTTYRLTYKPNFEKIGALEVARGWNFFWRPGKVTPDGNTSGTYQQMFLAGASGKPYKPFRTGDFTTI